VADPLVYLANRNATEAKESIHTHYDDDIMIVRCLGAGNRAARRMRRGRLHRGGSLSAVVAAQQLSLIRRPDALTLCEISGLL
jgi:hypothetical protein